MLDVDDKVFLSDLVKHELRSLEDKLMERIEEEIEKLATKKEIVGFMDDVQYEIRLVKAS